MSWEQRRPGAGGGEGLGPHSREMIRAGSGGVHVL